MPLQVIALIHWQALKLWLQARAVPPQAALRAGEGIGADVSVERASAGAAGGARPAGRPRRACRSLERVLAEARGRDARRPSARRRETSLRLGARGSDRRSTTAAFFRRLATRGRSSGSASPTRRASGAPTTSSGLLELLLRERRASVARAIRTCAASPSCRRGSTAVPASLAAGRNIALPLRPRQRALRARPRRDDDVLVRRLRARGRVARRGAASQAAAGLRRSSSSGPATTCSRSAAAGARFALVAAGEYGARVTGHHDLARAGRRSRGERVAEAGLADRVEILEQDFREHRRGVHEDRLDRDDRGDRREALRRRSSPRSTALLAAGRTRLRPDDPRPGRSASPLPLERRTGSSATSSPAASSRRCGALTQAAARALTSRRRSRRSVRTTPRRSRRWRERFHGTARRGARARLRRALRADLGLLPRLLRGGSSASACSVTSTASPGRQRWRR